MSRPTRQAGRRALHLPASPVLLGVLLAVAVLVVYAPALTFGFVNFDDPQYVLDNPHVRAGLTWNGIVWAATATYAGNWHPVTWASHMTDVQLYGLNPRGHHATSVILHLLNTLLLFGVLNRMTAQPLRSAVVAGLFGVHPLHVESVAWVAERKDVLSGLFAMLTLWAYVKYVDTGSRVRYGLVVLFFVVGLASKPMLVTLPFVLLLLDLWPLARTRRFRALVLEKVPLFACALASAAVTYLAQESAGAVRTFETLPAGRRLANAIVAYVSYIGQMIWPVNLAPLYPYAPDEPVVQVAAAALMLIGLTVLAFRARIRYGYVTIGWLWYLGMLVPVIGLIQVGSQPMADRYTYLPLIGLFIVVAWGVPDVLRLVGGSLRSPAAAFALRATAPKKAGRYETVAVVVMIGCIVLARQQVAIWANSIDLWEHTLRATRDNYRAHNNLAHALVAAGRAQEAFSHYEAALRLHPDSVEAHTGMGAILVPAGRLDEAIAHYRQALRVNPNDAITLANLGGALAQQGQFAEAETHLHAAVAAKPDLPQARSYLGVTLARQGRTSEAVAHFARLVELQPDDIVARRHLGSALAIEGRSTEAIQEFETAIRLDPTDARSRTGLGEALDAAGQLEAATLEYQKAVQLNPSLPEARADLGNSLARLGRVDEAETQLREAVRLRPDDSASRYDLAVVLWRKGQVADARQQLETVVRQNPAHEPARKMLADLTKRPSGSPSPGSQR